MTEDYKDKLFNYFNNNMQPGPPTDNNLQIEDKIQLSVDEGGLDHPKLKYLLKNNDGVENGMILYIDNIEDQETGHLRSIFMLRGIDGTYYKNIQYTTSNEELPEIEACYIEDDGTLFIKTSNTSTSFPNRIMMLNNICNKIDNDYKVKIRKSYNIQQYYGEHGFTCVDIRKSLTEAKYILIGYESTDNDTKRKVDILECTINVGAENEYNLIDNLSFTNGRIEILDTYIKWNADGEYRLKVLVNTHEYTIYLNELLKDYTSDILVHNFDLAMSNLDECRLIYSSYEDLIIGVYLSSDGSNQILRVIDITVDGSQADYRIAWVLSFYDLDAAVNIDNFTKFNLLGDYFYIPMTDGDGKNGIFVFTAISYGTSYIMDNVGNILNFESGMSYGLQEIVISQQYELVNMYTYNNSLTSEEYPITTTYTLLNQYVLKDYGEISINNYVPNISILRNNEKIVLARELYNVIRQQNTITSTIEVPNLMLNDTQIVKEELIAKANNIIDNNEEIIEKNIYEDLLINFNDTITVINNNNNNNILNTEASVDLVKSIAINKDYNKQMTKFKIVYQDNTEVINTLPAPTIEDRIATYHLVVGSNKPINRIEFISFDETTTYVIITLNVEANKVYIINQKVRVN